MDFNLETIISILHWNDQLMSLTLTRSPSFRFVSGQFVMVGIKDQQHKQLITRAYSIASSCYDDHLEFFSIKVQDGAFTSLLKKVSCGDTLMIARKPTGNLMISQLNPGQRLFLLASGTGLAPFLSIIQDETTYQQFEKVYLVHSVRQTIDLAYQTVLENMVNERFSYHPVVTRDTFHYQNRVTLGMLDGSLFKYMQCSPPSANDRFMLCGSSQFNRDLISILTQNHYHPSGALGEPGDFVFEKAYVG